jgi:hypothetical protein
LPPDEQVRVNGPGCVTCDLFEEFDHARIVALENAATALSEEQRRLLDTIDTVMHGMEESDDECFNNGALQCPVWQKLRELASDALHALGWEQTTINPFTEIRPGVWHRPPGDFFGK